MECMETSIKSTKKEVGELLTLCKWGQLMSMENSKRIRKKLRMLIQKCSVSVNSTVK